MFSPPVAEFLHGGVRMILRLAAVQGCGETAEVTAVQVQEAVRRNQEGIAGGEPEGVAVSSVAPGIRPSGGPVGTGVRW